MQAEPRSLPAPAFTSSPPRRRHRSPAHPNAVLKTHRCLHLPVPAPLTPGAKRKPPLIRGWRGPGSGEHPSLGGVSAHPRSLHAPDAPQDSARSKKNSLLLSTAFGWGFLYIYTRIDVLLSILHMSGSTAIKEITRMSRAIRRCPVHRTRSYPAAGGLRGRHVCAAVLVEALFDKILIR